MQIGIIIVVYSEFPKIAFDSIIGSTVHEITWYIYCHAIDEHIEQSLIAFCRSNRCELKLFRNNRGLSRSWNDGIVSSYSSGKDFTLVINDDISFRMGAFDAFIAFLMDRPAFALGFLHGEEPAHDDVPAQIRSQDYACFAFGILAYTEIGAFDENFFPAYREDTDYQIRVDKKNLPVIYDRRVLVDHERGKTLKRSPEIRAIIEATGHANNAYLFRKWGWTESGPTYDRQFDMHDCFISWESRHTPFNDRFDRLDLPQYKAPVLQIRSGLGPELNLSRDTTALAIARHGAICAFVVQAIYKSLLHRDAEPGAVARYSQELLSGMLGLTQFCEEVRGSQEYIDRLTAKI